MDRLDSLRIRQLGSRLKPFSRLTSSAVPREGWIRSIREALGLTAQGLSERMGVTRPAITQLERAEQQGRITLNKLREVAEALDSKLVYALVPTESLEAILALRARTVAQERMERVWHSMLLEGQEISSEEKERQIADLSRELLSGNPRDLWRNG